MTTYGEGIAPLGRVVLARYRIEELVAVGGGAVVYRALDCVTGELVAVKRPRDEIARTHMGAARFLREARVLLEMDHPCIPRAIAAGVDDEGMPWLAMQFVSGRDYEAIVAEDGPLPVPTALRIAACVARAVAHAHSRGVIHRDVKPANIAQVAGIDPPGGVYLVDFGIAQVARDARLTAQGMFAGTPEYASPEQLQGEPATAASDVYSLGATLFHLLTGAPPFRGSPSQLAVAHTCHAPAAVSALRPGTPLGVDVLVCAMLGKRPELRPFDLESLARTLDALAAAIDGGLDSCPALAADATVSTSAETSEALERLRVHAHHVHAILRASSSAEVRLFEELVSLGARTLARRSIERRVALAQRSGSTEELAALGEQLAALGDEAAETERRRAIEEALATLREHATGDLAEHYRKLHALETEVLNGS